MTIFPSVGLLLLILTICVNVQYDNFCGRWIVIANIDNMRTITVHVQYDNFPVCWIVIANTDNMCTLGWSVLQLFFEIQLGTCK